MSVLVMGKSKIAAIVMKNFNSVPVPQLQCFSYVHHCAVRSRHDSHSHQCRHSLLQRQLAALLHAGRLVTASVDWSSSFRIRVQNPWCELSRGFWHSNESNWFESTRLWHWIESFSFLLNRQSLLCSIVHHCCKFSENPANTFPHSMLTMFCPSREHAWMDE